MNTWSHGPLKIVTVNLSILDLKYIQKLMDKGLTPSRSEYVRSAVRHALKHDRKDMEYKEKVINEEIKLEGKNMIRIPGYNGNKPVEIIRKLEPKEPVEVKEVFY